MKKGEKLFTNSPPFYLLTLFESYLMIRQYALLRMKKLFPILLVAFLIGCVSPKKEPVFISSPTAKPEQTSPSIQSIVQGQGKAVVLIVTYDDSGNALKLGSGFFVKSDGVFITNFHVIEGASSAIVKLIDGRVFDDISLIDFNSEWDIAVLKAKGSGFPTVRLGNSDSVQTGQRIFVIGNPEGLQNTVSDGLISSVRKLETGEYVFQMSAPISGGSSGGPVYNMEGEVIGISTSMLETGQNLNFAIPIKYVHPLVEKITQKDLATVKKEFDKKTIDEYLKKQKTSKELEPEETISEEASSYYKKAIEKATGPEAPAPGAPAPAPEKPAEGFIPLLGTANQEAIELFKKAIKADPYYHAAHYVLGLSYLQTNQLELAEKELITANSIKPLFSDGHSDLGEVYYKLGKLSNAISEYKRALELEPDKPYTNLVLGKAFREKKEYETAINHFKRANELIESGYPQAQFEMAMTYSEMKQFVKALDTLRQIDNTYFFYEGLDRGLAIYESIYEVNKKNPIYLQNYAYIYFLKYDYVKAIEFFQDAFKLDESKFRCNYELGKSYYDTVQYTKAIEYLEKAVKQEPGNYNAFMSLGEIYSFGLHNDKFEPNYDKAIESYKKAIQLKPSDPVAYKEIASTYYYKNDLRAAKEYVLSAISLNKQYAEAFNLLGNINKKEKNYEDALKNYEKALELHQSAFVYRDIGNVYEEQEMYDEALKYYQEANKSFKFGKYGICDRDIAGIYLKQKKYPEAISIYKKRVEKFPSIADTHFDLAYAYSESEQTEKAIEEYQRVLELEPQSYGAHYNLGLAYLILGRKEDAERVFFHLKKYLELTKDIKGKEENRKFALSQITAKEFPQKLQRLKMKGGDVGAIATLLLLRLDYNKGNNQFIEGSKETKYEDGRNIVSPDIFVAESTFESLHNDIKKIRTSNAVLQEVIDKFEKAVNLRIEGIKTSSQAFYILKKDYKGEYEKGIAKIKVADSYFLDFLKSLQQVMKKYKDHFSETEIELLSGDISYYSPK